MYVQIRQNSRSFFMSSIYFLIICASIYSSIYDIGQSPSHLKTEWRSY